MLCKFGCGREQRNVDKKEKKIKTDSRDKFSIISSTSIFPRHKICSFETWRADKTTGWSRIVWTIFF